MIKPSESSLLRLLATRLYAAVCLFLIIIGVILRLFWAEVKGHGEFFPEKVSGSGARTRSRPLQARHKAAVSQRDLFSIWNLCAIASWRVFPQGRVCGIVSAVPEGKARSVRRPAGTPPTTIPLLPCAELPD